MILNYTCPCRQLKKKTPLANLEACLEVWMTKNVLLLNSQVMVVGPKHLTGQLTDVLSLTSNTIVKDLGVIII